LTVAGRDVVVRDALSAAVAAGLAGHGVAVRTLSPDEGDRAVAAIEVGPVGVAPAGRPSVEIGASDQCCADPVFDAVRRGVPRLPVVFRAGDAGRSGEIALPAECDWEQAVSLVADLVAAWLAEPDPVDETLPAVGASSRPTLTPVEAWTRIDWSTSPASIAALVRAGRRPGSAAWTWLDGVRVAVARARVVTGPASSAPPGTVLDNRAGLLVGAIGGLVLIGDVSDVIGPVEPASVRPGTVLGLDVQQELVELRQRVADLEHVVRRLAADAEFL
jgi:Formyl transferase, C-terminal domain